MAGTTITFIAFGLVGQSLLVAFFAARRWAPARAEPIGRAAYAFGAAGLPVGLVLALAGAPLLAPGPLLTAGWAAFGWWVDQWRPRPWRGPTVQWPVLVPYVALYLFAQMWSWWPLWTLARPAWAAYLVLFVANTALNLRGHVAAVR